MQSGVMIARFQANLVGLPSDLRLVFGWHALGWHRKVNVVPNAAFAVGGKTRLQLRVRRQRTNGCAGIPAEPFVHGVPAFRARKWFGDACHIDTRRGLCFAWCLRQLQLIAERTLIVLSNNAAFHLVAFVQESQAECQAQITAQ